MPRDTSGISTRFPSAKRHIVTREQADGYKGEYCRFILKYSHQPEDKALTSDHMRKLMAPSKRNNDLPSSIITRNESMRVCKYIRELSQ